MRRYSETWLQEETLYAKLMPRDKEQPGGSADAGGGRRGSADKRRPSMMSKLSLGSPIKESVSRGLGATVKSADEYDA